MSDKSEPATSSTDNAEQKELDSQQASAKQNKVKKVTNGLIIAIAVSLGVSIVSDRIVPSTDNARVQGYVVPVKPQVSGQVIDIEVQPNQLVSEGDILVSLNPVDYEIAVKKAEQDLEIAGQNVGAQTQVLPRHRRDSPVRSLNVIMLSCKLDECWG